MNSELKKGDTVRLKSGSPVMTMGHVNQGFVTCLWFVDKELKQGKFSVAMLVKADPNDDELPPLPVKG